jgi:hypothetical protein
VAGDQTAQDYVAFPYVQFAPDDGETVCRMPYIVVNLILSDLTRNLNGAFNASSVTFTLDGGPVLNLSTIRVQQTAPHNSVHIVYKPSTNLSLGSHRAEFMHPEESGPITDTWSFTAANIACTDPILLAAPADAEILQAPDYSSAAQTRQGLLGGISPAQPSSAAAPQSQTDETSDAAPQAAEDQLAAQKQEGAPAASVAAQSTLVTGIDALGVPHPGLYPLLLDGQK